MMAEPAEVFGSHAASRCRDVGPSRFKVFRGVYTLLQCRTQFPLHYPNITLVFSLLESLVFLDLVFFGFGFRIQTLGV